MNNLFNEYELDEGFNRREIERLSQGDRERLIDNLFDNIYHSEEDEQEEPVQEEQDDQGITDNSNLSTEMIDALEQGHSITTSLSNDGIEEEEPVVEEEPEVEEPVRRRRTPNDYELAWDIYSLGYSTGDVAHIFNSSAGSISRGIKKNGHEMRTGAETRAMRKTDPSNFGIELMERITDTLEGKFATEEERNDAFYKAFGKNLYDVTVHVVEDEEELNLIQASEQGISIGDLDKKGLDSEVYEGRPLSSYMQKVKGLHQTMDTYARDLFGDVNVDDGGVTITSKVTYENGIVLTVKDAYKLNEKAVSVNNVNLTVNIADYLMQSMEREVEGLSLRLESLLRNNFKDSNGEALKLMNLGNSLVVSIDNV